MNEITMESYVAKKLGARIATLEEENAKLEFAALKHKQDADDLKKKLDKWEKTDENEKEVK